MDSINKFEQQLAAIIGRPSDLRPFVCEGSPLECQVFIVGFNPATSMSANFWKFWRTGYGFDKAVWYEAYKKDRMTRPLEVGKTRRNAVSNTRRVLDWIAESAAPIRCLETNIYSAPTVQAEDLDSQQRITDPFDFLLTQIKPKVIVAHGSDAVGHVRRMALSAQVIPISHLSRGWSKEAACALGQQIKSAYGNAQQGAPADGLASDELGR